MQQKITIDGSAYWYLQAEDGEHGGPIAPLEHCFEDGELNPITMFSSETFAHVYPDGHISRFGKNIGNIKDFITK
jgi:hypothetical protein